MGQDLKLVDERHGPLRRQRHLALHGDLQELVQHQRALLPVRRAVLRHGLRQLDLRRLLPGHKCQLARGRPHQLHQERRVAPGQAHGHQEPQDLLVLRGALPGDLLPLDHSPPSSLLRLQHGLPVSTDHSGGLFGFLFAAGQHRQGQHRHHHPTQHNRVLDARGRVDAAHERAAASPGHLLRRHDRNRLFLHRHGRHNPEPKQQGQQGQTRAQMGQVYFLARAGQDPAHGHQELHKEAARAQSVDRDELWWRQGGRCAIGAPRVARLSTCQ